MRSMIGREVWRKTERKKRPNDRRLIGNKWVFKIKRDGTYRARLVALGDSQIPGVDYKDNFAPVAHDVSFRIALLNPGFHPRAGKLPQADMLANKLLKCRLAQHGYYEVCHTPGYWRHTWRPIDFTLVVDSFAVSYKENEHALHLVQTLCKYYEAVSVDWKGTLYCGITLKWDYRQKTCELSMPGYVQQAVDKFQHGIKSSNKAIDAPHPYKATKKQ